MNDLTQKNTPDELYREYQNTRDNIPESVYSEIVSKAEQVRHDENIHQILQQAKIAENSRAQSPAQTNDVKASFADRIKNLFTLAPAKTWGTAFASVALAVIILPIAMNSSAPQFSEVAHLDGCTQCGAYISNASATTRSVAPGLSKTDPQARIAARLGRINASVKISAMLEDDAALSASFKELRKLTNKAPKTESATTNDMLNAIQLALTENRFKTTFTAAEAIHIAEITARFALNEGQSNGVRDTLNSAVNAYSNIDDLSLLQQSILNDLRAMQTSPEISGKADLEKTIQLYSRAMESLGA